MLQNIRDKSKGWGTWLIVGAVAAGFIGMGASSYISSSASKGKVVATVDGKDITSAEFDAAYKNMKQQMANSPLSANDQLLKAEALGQLIEHYALLNNIQAHGFYVSTEQTDQVLRTLPVFQVDGKFSQEQYNKVLQRFGYTTNQLREDIGQQMLVNQLNQGLMKSAFALNGEVTQFTQLLNEKRDIGYFKVDNAAFINKVAVDAKEITAFYKQHQKEFITPEKVRISSIELSLADFQKHTTISSQEIKDYYQQNIASFSKPLQRHFDVLDFPLSQKDVQAIEKARKNAKAALMKAKQGESFAKLIKDYQLKSNSSTGEWGWFNRNQFPPTISDRLFSIEKTGDVVLLERTGMLQVVKLTGVRPATTTPLAEVSEKIKATLLKKKAQAAFNNAVEQLKSLQAEYPNDLNKIAKILNVKANISPWFSRDQGAGLAQNSKVLNAAFSSEVLQQNTNSPVLQLDDQHAVVIHLAAHQAAKLKPLKQVEAQITTTLKQQKAQKMAKAEADKITDLLKSGTSYRDITKQFGLTWHQLNGLSRQSKNEPFVVKAAFAMPTPAGKILPVTVTSLPEQGYLVTQLYKVIPGQTQSMKSFEQQAYQEGVQQLYAQYDYSRYVSTVRDKATVKLNNG
ncbi:SurA N-terminal domain-containing protein [Piscirickettsia litoralis]|uniref:Periplasmic chaperone PpiD n=1 Tax=Piscirickettsia litoralis TaxID=1891921 RepID=A0ABX3A0K4_9GAMM|nr:SurA N-terminal domain-containing protein [Piscirickettsia litoralis]ODN42387.1 surA N-terminal domain protein [Piscirickettsia litoralis]